MKRISFLLICCSLILISCAKVATDNQEEQLDEKLNYPIIAFVENFIKSHPDFDNNEITREQTAKDFLESFTTTSDSVNLLKGIPVKMLSMTKDSHGKVMAQFRSAQPITFKFPEPISDINFDVVASIDPKFVNILNEGDYYTLNGNLIGAITNHDTFCGLLGKNVWVWTCDYSVEKSDTYDNQLVINLGMLYVDIDSISTTALKDPY